ncbi:L,D-transpeptidase [uncultured Dialister sp.]|uniref:L,D-transpeptidase n=1 Tax=uncultured Dialister sp. TaxID=278064 RepID=UPI00265A5189|nr:L,D-transpeptidase [uncultured Dialister sp.]
MKEIIYHHYNKKGIKSVKHIILAAALCAALGTCGLAEVNAAEEVWNGHEEVTVIKGKILRTETVKKADHHKKIQKTEKKEKAEGEKGAPSKEAPVLAAKKEAKASAAETAVKETKQAPAVEKSAETAPKDTEALKKAPEKPRFEDKRIEINLASRLLTLYQGDVGIRMYPIAPGKPSSPTPTGRRTVVDMEINPTWIDPDSGTSIPSGPDCPIGTYASHGCVRMNEADVEDLYAHIVKGIPVDILYERVVVQREADHTVVYYIYPDGYGKEPLDVSKVKAKLAPFGVASCVSDDDIKQAIEASDGNPRYVAKVYDIYLDGRKLDARAFGKDGHIYLPVMPLARAAGIKADWSSNWNQIRTPYGSAKAVLKNRSLLIDAADAPALLHLAGNLDENYNYQMK